MPQKPQKAHPQKGFQTFIWNNNAKSILLLALYPLIIAGVVFSVIAMTGYLGGQRLTYEAGNISHNASAAMQYALIVTYRYWPVILSAVIIWFIIAYFLQGKIIRAMARSHPATRKEEPTLYNLVENMCISSGVKPPRIEIIETHARNAFASGIDEGSYCITVTRGLMQSLSKDELEAVLAHELAHILNRDVRLMMICVIFTGMLGVLTQIVWAKLRYALWIPAQGRHRMSGVILLLMLVAILGVGYLAGMLTRFAISRRREFMADAGAVKITKNPDAMMRALLRISGSAAIPKAPADIRTLCFENALPVMGLFATHPPIAQRIAAISAYSGLPAPEIAVRRRAEDADVFGRPAPDVTRSNWATRQRFRHRRPANPWQ